MGLDIEKVAMLTSMVDKLIQMKRVDNALDESVVEDPVSYTPLTLPTIQSV